MEKWRIIWFISNGYSTTTQYLSKIKPVAPGKRHWHFEMHKVGTSKVFQTVKACPSCLMMEKSMSNIIFFSYSQRNVARKCSAFAWYTACRVLPMERLVRPKCHLLQKVRRLSCVDPRVPTIQWLPLHAVVSPWPSHQTAVAGWRPPGRPKWRFRGPGAFDMSGRRWLSWRRMGQVNVCIDNNKWWKWI